MNWKPSSWAGSRPSLLALTNKDTFLAPESRLSFAKLELYRIWRIRRIISFFMLLIISLWLILRRTSSKTTLRQIPVEMDSNVKSYYYGDEYDKDAWVESNGRRFSVLGKDELFGDLSKQKQTCDDQLIADFLEPDDKTKNVLSDSQILTVQYSYQRFMKADIPLWGDMSTKYKGRGIVIVVRDHGEALRALRGVDIIHSLNVNIAIELHYDPAVISQKLLVAFMGYSVRLVDKTQYDENFEISGSDFANHKTLAQLYALVNSNCLECIILDPNDLVLTDPTYLFDSARFVKFGAIFFPSNYKKSTLDLWWKLINKPCVDEFRQLSTPVLVNKAVKWRSIMLALHFAKQTNIFSGSLISDDLLRMGCMAANEGYSMLDITRGFLATKNADMELCGHLQVLFDANGRPVFAVAAYQNSMQGKKDKINNPFELLISTNSTDGFFQMDKQ